MKIEELEKIVALCDIEEIDTAISKQGYAGAVYSEYKNIPLLDIIKYPCKMTAYYTNGDLKFVGMIYRNIPLCENVEIIDIDILAKRVDKKHREFWIPADVYFFIKELQREV